MVHAGRVGSLKIRPGEIFVTVSAVAIAGDFAVRCPYAPDAATAGGVVSYRREAVYITDFKHDRTAEDLPDTGRGEKMQKLLPHVEFPGNELFYLVDILLAMVHEAHARNPPTFRSLPNISRALAEAGN